MSRYLRWITSVLLCHCKVNRLHLYRTFPLSWPLKALYTASLHSPSDCHAGCLLFIRRGDHSAFCSQTAGARNWTSNPFRVPDNRSTRATEVKLLYKTNVYTGCVCPTSVCSFFFFFLMVQMEHFLQMLIRKCVYLLQSNFRLPQNSWSYMNFWVSLIGKLPRTAPVGQLTAHVRK